MHAYGQDPNGIKKWQKKDDDVTKTHWGMIYHACSLCLLQRREKPEFAQWTCYHLAEDSEKMKAIWHVLESLWVQVLPPANQVSWQTVDTVYRLPQCPTASANLHSLKTMAAADSLLASKPHTRYLLYSSLIQNLTQRR